MEPEISSAQITLPSPLSWSNLLGTTQPSKIDNKKFNQLLKEVSNKISALGSKEDQSLQEQEKLQNELIQKKDSEIVKLQSDNEKITNDNSFTSASEIQHLWVAGRPNWPAVLKFCLDHLSIKNYE